MLALVTISRSSRSSPVAHCPLPEPFAEVAIEVDGEHSSLPVGLRREECSDVDIGEPMKATAPTGSVENRYFEIVGD